MPERGGGKTMLEPYRGQFNANFTEAKYDDLRQTLNRKTRTEISFQMSETPCFFEAATLDEMVQLGLDLTEQLLENPAYMAASARAIPERYRVPGKDSRPHFMTVDFGFVRGADGTLRPKLVELQAFPSIFGFQEIISQQYVESFGLPENLKWRFGGRTETQYWQLLRDVIVGGHDPENVVLMEVAPEQQKTLPDFHVFADRLGIQIVDITTVRSEGKRLFYERDGRRIPIRRIFNRAIADEMERDGVRPGFEYRDEFEVEWAGHPNWYFQVSKFSLPWLSHPAVPKAMFLDEWMAKPGRLALPSARLLLKPLYSYAGKGIQFAPTMEELRAIPVEARRNYLIQERVDFEPVIRTPFGMTQAEIRVMYVRRDGERWLEPVTTLVRLGRGKMMGVDHNRNQRWVGGSVAFFPI